MSIDYPSIAVSYSETRSALAKNISQHRWKAAKAAEPAEIHPEKLKRVGRLRKAKDAVEA